MRRWSDIKKQISTILILLIIVIMSSGCANTGYPLKGAEISQTAVEFENPQKAVIPEEYLTGGVREALLNGYPQSLLPLYRCIKVYHSYFETNHQYYSDFSGMDVYVVMFDTEASKEEAEAYYEGLLTSGQKQDMFSKHICKGKIGGNPVRAEIDFRYSPNIILVLGLTEEQRSGNPYIGDYPKEFENFGGVKNTLYSTYYERTDYEDGLHESYSIIYDTGLSSEQFISYCEDIFSGYQFFNKMDYNFSWSGIIGYEFENAGYYWTIYYEMKGSASKIEIYFNT